MIVVITREIESGGSSSKPPTPSAGGRGSGSATPNGGTNGDATPPSTGKARASGVEEHVSSAQARPGHTAASSSAGDGSASAGGTKKKEYTAKQVEVVMRVKKCKHHQYYEILAGQWSPPSVASG